jgi:hypothetical protein
MTATPATAARTARRRILAAAALAAATLTTAGALAGAAAGTAGASVLTNCAAKPSACGYPDATNTGVPAGTTLLSVPSQVSSGPGWSYNAADGDVVVTGAGTVLSGLSIPCSLVIDASNVTVKDVQVITGGTSAISLTHTTGVTIENSTISGLNATTGRVNEAIADTYGDSTGMTIKDNNISAFRIGIQASTGLIEGNYIHDPGYIAGDHTNGIVALGTTQPMTIEDNTIFNNLGQTDDLTLDASTAGAPVANRTIEGNFFAGGDYDIYGGNAGGSATSDLLIENNRFGQQYAATSGTFGPVAYYTATGTGNVWSGNIWDTTGATVAS